MASFEASGTVEAGGTGLSKHIRALGISETYDLAGFGEAQVMSDERVGGLAGFVVCLLPSSRVEISKPGMRVQEARRSPRGVVVQGSPALSTESETQKARLLLVVVSWFMSRPGERRWRGPDQPKRRE